MPEVHAAKSRELKEGERKIVKIEGHEIGVLRANGTIIAFSNICPHQGGPVCEGLLLHKVEDDIAPDKTYRGMRFSDKELHIVCPWHGWEFDLATGRCAGDGKVVLKKYRVVERGDDVFISL